MTSDGERERENARLRKECTTQCVIASDSLTNTQEGKITLSCSSNRTDAKVTTAPTFYPEFAPNDFIQECLDVLQSDRDATEPIPPNRTAVAQHRTWASNWDITAAVLAHAWDCAQGRQPLVLDRQWLQRCRGPAGWQQRNGMDSQFMPKRVSEAISNSLTG